MKKIMVVDDEFIVRVGIRSIMNWEEHGYTMVADASSGEEALEKIAQYRPDIVLTDLKMENMDGFELIRQCAEKYPNICFVVLSSYNDFENVRQAMKLGARDYIFKLTAKPEAILTILDELGREIINGPPPVEPQYDRLKDVIRENLSAIKYNLLCKCLSSAGSSDIHGEDILSQFTTLGLGVDLLRPYRVLYIAIDDFEKLRLAGELRDLTLIKSSMENIIRELLGKEYAMEVFNCEKGDAAIFINTLPALEGGDFHKLAEEFSRIMDYINRYLGFTISGVISPELQDVNTLPVVFRICGDTLSYRNSGDQLCPYNNGVRSEIARAREFIAEHLGERLGVQETAAHVGMSESYFSHLFKKETGMNFIDYVNRLKMEKAAVLLENSSLKVSDVAGQLGIDNSNYFSVIFKKVMGCAPHEYRARIKK